MLKTGDTATFFGTRTMLIRAVPNIFCSVNGALVRPQAKFKEEKKVKNHYFYIAMKFAQEDSLAQACINNLVEDCNGVTFSRADV